MFKVGLRAEIILNISIVVGAALLFGGFLLLRLTERELVEERVAGITSLTLSLASAAQVQTVDQDATLRRAATLLRNLSPSAAPESWSVVDANSAIYAFLGPRPQDLPDVPSLRTATISSEPVVRVSYPGAWWPFSKPPPAQVTVTAGLLLSQGGIGAIHARYSLEDIRGRLIAAHKLVLLYVVCYGTVLIGFGTILLERNVVGPVRRLLAGIRKVGAGDFQEQVPVAGPGEIAELAGSFNGMLEALEKSRRQTEAHICNLEETNRELRQTRLELLRSERMASVGHLATGMAHEIGNPLGAIMGYLEYLRKEADHPVQVEVVERALVESGRIDQLVRDLLGFATPPKKVDEQVDPCAILNEAKNLVEGQGKFDGISLVVECPEHLPPVCIAQHKLMQVLVNLLLNARDAMAKGGTLRLAGGLEQKVIWLSVTDSGAGIPEAVLPHIFDPFYTTKPEGQGRGLGLSICHRIIEEAGGKIEVRAVSGGGTTFIVSFPVMGDQHGREG